MIIRTPKGQLINLNAISWICVDEVLGNPGRFCVNTNIGELTGPMNRESAQAILDRMADALGAITL